MPFCNACGAPIPTGARYCQACGAEQKQIGASPGGSASLAGPGPRPASSLSSSPAGLVMRPLPVPADLPFHPQEEEILYRIIVPNPRLKWRLMIGGLLSAVIFLVFIIPFAASFLLSGAAFGALIAVVAFLVVVFALIVGVSIVYALLAYSKFRYWVTNHRTIGRRGVIGYSIDSIPLETISDIVVQRSVADRILGLSSIWIQPFGGGSIAGYGAAQYRFGALSQSNSFLGLLPPEATDLQRLILHLRDLRRRETGRLI
ncbi:MAG TPA: PH domain-containing protein [Thermoplasmata archaeon]|nr:PH domain-containing protein [Thermoplasmata archaeon]HEV2428955.1 PH domain-containing protein [Thermoplasmata archaeon]